MAYTIPVLALILDDSSIEQALGLEAGYMADYDNDRYEVAEQLSKLTGAPFSTFSDEEGDLFFVGISLASEFEIVLDAAMLAKEATVKKNYPHPLVQATRLTVVSTFC